MSDTRSMPPRMTIGRLMLAVAGFAVLLSLPATFGRSGSLVLGFLLGAVAAALIPALLVCRVQSQVPSPRDAQSARLLAACGAVFDALAWFLAAKFYNVGKSDAAIVMPTMFVAGYVGYMMAAVAGLIEVPGRSLSWTKLASLAVVLSTLPFALGAGPALASTIEEAVGRG